MILIKLKIQYFTIIVCFLVTLSLFGCAGTRGSINPVQSLDVNVHLNKYNGLLIKSLNVETSISLSDRTRIINLIKSKILEKDSTYFHLVDGLNERLETIQVTLLFRRYDQGNAFARFMLAGLGQIHIDADLLIEETTPKKTIAQYTVSKTFAWGGAYGATTNIQDVEEGFAEAVVSVLFEEK